MMSVDRKPSREAGMTIVELLVAVFVLLVGALGVVALVDGANKTTAANRAREGATSLTRELIEDARAVSYGSLTSSGVAATIASLSGGTVQGSTVVYSRRGVQYTVAPSLCFVDDPKDGYGSHAGATYCGNETASTPPDTFPLDYKRFTIITSWKGARGDGVSRQSAVINDPGSAFAPQITAFSMTAPTTCTGNPKCTQIDAAVSSSASFSVTTSTPATKVTWYVNDAKMGIATGSGTGPWTFTWPLATVVTGTYVVSVRANAGKDGPVRSLSIPVKDAFPNPPTNLYGGYNQLWTSVAELNWTPVPSGVLGYRVERNVGGVWSLVTCYDVTGQTGTTRPLGSYCMDKGAPAPATPSTPLQYRIFSVFDINGTPTNSGTTTNVTIAPPENVRPCPPSNPDAPNGKKVAFGLVVWSAPSASGAGTCDLTRVRFFRIYRRENPGSGNAKLPAGTMPLLSERVFSKSSATVRQWADAAQTNRSNYWITSVDDRNAESIVAGPVS